MTTLTPAQKADLALDLTSHDNAPALNLLITRAVNQAETLADVHYALSVYIQALKTVNQKIVERMEKDIKELRG